MFERLRNVRFHLLGITMALLFSLPLYWALIASLGETGAPPLSVVQWWPQQVHWENYGRIFELLPMGRYLANSLLVVAAAIPLTLLTASLAGFGISQLEPSAQRRLLLLCVALLLVPAMSIWLFRFHILRWLGLLDSLWALIVPAFAASNPLFVLLYCWTFRRVPAGVFEAAQLDGAQAVTIWWRVARPLARPTSVAVAILTFAQYWSDFTSPVIYIYRPEYYTLPVGLQLLKQMDATNWPLLMAAAILMTAPVILLFVLLRRALPGDLSLGNLLDRN